MSAKTKNPYRSLRLHRCRHLFPLIDLQGMRLFHAGDLNNWHWSEESTPQEIRKAEGDFLAEIKNLQQKAPR